MNDTLSRLFDSPDGATLRFRCEALLAHMDVRPLVDAFFAYRRHAVLPPFDAPCAALGFFPDGFYPSDEFFTPAKRLFDAASIPHAAGFMAVYYAVLPETLALCERYGVPKDIARGASRAWLNAACAYRARYGTCGVEDYITLGSLLCPELFCVGALQMRLCAFPYDDVSFPDGCVRNGQPIVQVHVPDGADLSRASLDNAYDRAVELFGTELFLADSWLLYPEHEHMLPADSAIRGFMRDYHVFHVDTTCDYEGLWRVFGKKADYRTAVLPTDTTLQRAYATRVAEGLPIGSGVGVMRRKKADKNG